MNPLRLTRDPGRIPETLRLIQAIWAANPGLRLGQLLMTAMGNPFTGEIHKIEDDRLFPNWESGRLPLRGRPASIWAG